MVGYHAKLCAIAVLMLVLYAGIIAFGLNEFRKTPVGFIPQVGLRLSDHRATQLPPGAALARTDEVNRPGVDIALEIPGIAHAVNIVGFSGVTFTNAPNSVSFRDARLFREAGRRSAAVGSGDLGASCFSACR